MKTNPVLEEIWEIKDALAREAGLDIRRLCENTRKWAAEHPHSGPVVGNAGELRQLAEAKQRLRAEAEVMVWNDQPPA